MMPACMSSASPMQTATGRSSGCSPAPATACSETAFRISGAQLMGCRPRVDAWTIGVIVHSALRARQRWLCVVACSCHSFWRCIALPYGAATHEPGAF